ncbi:hypothetical protein H8E65_07490 [Candidatus Bathyarchaeota archaeon]|nr:hypothetical protein [Candidatus Bathyarchaeota archaeon]
MKSLKGSRQIAVTSLAVLVVLLMPLSWALADTSPPYAEWSRTFGGSEDDSGLSVQETSDGGYIITGNTYSVSTGGWDAYLVKTDSQGREEWNRTFGGPDFDVGYSVRETIDGGYIIAGYTGPIDAPGARAYLVKTDSQGLEEWSRTLGDSQDDGGRSVQETSDGGYIITGHAIPFGADATDVYLVKTDSQGLEEWSRTFGGSSTDEGYSVQQTSDGGYIITGTTWSFGDGGGDVYLVKTDSQGLEEWSRTFGGSDFDVGYSVQETRDGGYIIAGVRDGVYTPPMTLRTNEAVFGDVYLVKTDSQGLEEWSRTFGGSEDDGGRSVQETSDGGYVIAGWTYSFGSGEGDVYFVKTNSQGTEGSSLTFGGSSTDEGYSVQETRDGEYIIAGITWSFGSGGVDVYLVKTDHLWSESEEEPITPPLPPLTPMLSNLAITPAEIESGDVVTISLDIEATPATSLCPAPNRRCD